MEKKKEKDLLGILFKDSEKCCVSRGDELKFTFC